MGLVECGSAYYRGGAIGPCGVGLETFGFGVGADLSVCDLSLLPLAAEAMELGLGKLSLCSSPGGGPGHRP